MCSAPRDSYFDRHLGRVVTDSLMCNDTFLYNVFYPYPVCVSLRRFNLSVSKDYPSCYSWTVEIYLKRTFPKKVSVLLEAFKITVGKEVDEDICIVKRIYDIREDEDLREQGRLLEDERETINLVWTGSRKKEKVLNNTSLSEILYKTHYRKVKRSIEEQ